MSENKIPKSIENRIDLKAVTINSFAAATNCVKEQMKNVETPTFDENSQLVLMTNFGLVEGSLFFAPCSKEKIDSSNYIKDQVINKLNDEVFRIRNTRIAEKEEENKNLELINNFSVVRLKNVTITDMFDDTKTRQLDYLTLFTDQILGFSFK